MAGTTTEAEGEDSGTTEEAGEEAVEVEVVTTAMIAEAVITSPHRGSTIGGTTITGGREGSRTTLGIVGGE